MEFLEEKCTSKSIAFSTSKRIRTNVSLNLNVFRQTLARIKVGSPGEIGEAVNTGITTGIDINWSSPTLWPFSKEKGADEAILREGS